MQSAPACALLVALSLLAGAHSQQAESADSAIESQCRPYVEKALREFSTAEHTPGGKEEIVQEYESGVPPETRDQISEDALQHEEISAGPEVGTSDEAGDQTPEEQVQHGEERTESAEEAAGSIDGAPEDESESAEEAAPGEEAADTGASEEKAPSLERGSDEDARGEESAEVKTEEEEQISIEKDESAEKVEGEEGAVSAEEAAASTGEEAPSTEEDTASVEEGAPSTEEGEHSAEEGAPTAEEGAPSTEEGDHSVEEGEPSVEEGEPSVEEGAPSAEEGAVSAEDGAPSGEEGALSAEDGTASAEDGAPSGEEAAASAEEGAASAEEVAPSTEKSEPSAEEGAPSAEEGAPSAEEGAPSAEEGAPSAEEGASSAEDKTVSMEEGATSAEEVARSAEEGAVSGEEGAASLEEKITSTEDVPSVEEAATSAGTPSEEEGAPSAEEKESTETVKSEEPAEPSAEEKSVEETTVSTEESKVADEKQTSQEDQAVSGEAQKDNETESVSAEAETGAPVPEEKGGEEPAAEYETTPEEDLTQEMEIPENLRSREHIAQILHLDSESAERELLLEKVGDIIRRDLKRLYDSAIKPLETLYKYRDLSNRHFGDPEIFSKPLILFMGPWSGGKSSIINYLLDNEYATTSLRTGAEPSPAYFNILMWGERPEVLDGTQLAADWTFSGLQKFGQGLLDRLRGLRLPNKLLEKVNIVEIPGILEIRKQVERLFPFNDACQWFIDRADIIFLVYDPAKLDVGPETEAILDQLKGRESQTRIILNKADQVKPEELMRVQGTLIWNISPLMSSPEPPVMYSTSLWSMPYEQGAPVRLLYAQERAFLRDLRTAIDRRVENKIASARRFAVRVRNHAKMVDCYLTTYYNHKGLFGNRKRVSDDIIERPQDYHIYEGLSTLTNISRYDLPDPEVYRDFFRLNPLYDFPLLSSTCTYFRGCPINRLDVAIAYDLPELVGKYRKASDEALAQLEAKGQS